MVSAIRLTETGGPEVLRLKNSDPVDPGTREVLIEHDAIGINYLEIMQRKGTAPIQLPNGLGFEAAGRVAAIGTSVEDVSVGDRVAYILGAPGSYASSRVYPADRLVKLPDTLGFEDAAAVLFNGITAQYLLKSTYPVGPGTVVLLYGVAGAVGQIMAPWAKHLGAFVIGVVSREVSVERARALGCDAVLVWGACDLPSEVARLTGGAKAHVVYDPLGRETFAASLDSLRPRGLLVSFGASTGAPPPIEVGTLAAKGSLFLTRPSLAAHATDLAEYRDRAADVFAAVSLGFVKPTVWKSFPLAEAAAAHAAVEGGTSAGKVLLHP